MSFSASAWRWVLVACAVWTIGVSWLVRLPCHQLQWDGRLPYGGACYSDIPFLYARVGMVDGHFPYLVPDALLEYPVLQSVIATVTGVFSWAITPVTSVHVAQGIYFDVNAVTIAALWAVTVLVASKMIASPRVLLALALAPAVAATALINWDLWVVCVTVVALYFLRRERWVPAGVFLGLGTALKLWPFVLLGAVIVLGIRRRELRPVVTTAVSLVATWLVVNVPFYLWDREQWGYFWGFSSDRSAGFSSIYHVWDVAIGPALGYGELGAGTINVIAYGGFAVLCAGILALGLLARREPSIEQLSLLIVAAFVLTNKVYSPQFVLWLVPLVLLARPRVVEFLIWQAIEVFHWVAIFSWLNAVSWSDESLPAWTTTYVIAVLAHVVAVAGICALVIRDVLSGRAPRDLAPDAANLGPEHQGPASTAAERRESTNA
ncbi:glycosyltransferase family 87 protein [Kocuria coralli]|uniref:glycosyltransferase family 87 protein n=1 Tax=Kocuria coralli TaxID=1461025 RepID=UPI0015F2B2E0|nr:glycosyltransferase 87 family protein [Kocuria coralli]